MKFYNILSPERGCTAALRGFFAFFGGVPLPSKPAAEGAAFAASYLHPHPALRATFPRLGEGFCSGELCGFAKGPISEGGWRGGSRAWGSSGAPLGELPPQAAEGAALAASYLHPHPALRATFPRLGEGFCSGELCGFAKGPISEGAGAAAAATGVVQAPPWGSCRHRRLRG